MPTIMLNGNPLEIPCEPGLVSDGYHTFDELYEHRCLLFCLIVQQANLDPVGFDISSWKSRKHSDDSTIDGWFIAGLWLSGAGNSDPKPPHVSKMITYHLPNRMWDFCECDELNTAPQWDGHTSQEVLERLRWFLKDAR